MQSSNEEASNTPSEISEPVAAENALLNENSEEVAVSTPPKRKLDPRRVSQGGDLDPQGILSPETVSVKQRFLYARRLQEMREKERLNQVKLNPQQTIRTARRSIYQMESEEVHSPASKAFSDKLLDGVSTEKIWADTVQKMKQQQQERSLVMKGSTVAYSQELQQNRVVTQRIKQWEALFIQTETTAQELSQIWRIVKDYFQLLSSAAAAEETSEKDTEKEKESRDKNRESMRMTLDDSAAGNAFEGRQGETHNFALGSTRVYAANTFGEATQDYLQKSFPAKAKYLGLVSGVYSDKSYKPPLRVISMALRGDSGAFYVAVSIKPLVGHEDDANLLGTRKIVVFSPENTKEKLFDVSFNIVFTPEREVREGEGEGETPEDDDDLLVVDVHDCNSLNAFDALSRTASQRRSLGGEPADFVVPEEYQGSISTASPYVDKDESADKALSSVTEEEEGEDGDDEKQEEEDNAVAAELIAAEDAAHTTETHMEEDVKEDELSAAVSASADLADAEEIAKEILHHSVPVPESLSSSAPAHHVSILSEALHFEQNNVTFTLAPENLDYICSNSRYLIIGCRNQTAKNILLSSTSLKVMNVTSHNTVSQNQTYEWVRGISASGWIAKFPSTMSVGRYQRRFFILQDNTLTYYKSKPMQEEFFNAHDYKANIALDRHHDEELEDPLHGLTVGGYYVGGKAMILTEDTKLELCLTLLNPTLKITTPSTNQSLLLRMKRGTDKEKYWLAALKKTIDIQKRKRTTASPTFKTLWLHDNPSYRLVSVDVKALFLTPSSPPYAVKAALFHCDVPAYGKRLQHDNTPRYLLDLDCGEEKLQMELVVAKNDEQRTAEEEQDDEGVTLLVSTQVSLRTVKVVSDSLVVLSGDAGFLALGEVRTLSSAEGERKVLFVAPLSSPVHSERITCACVEKDTIVAADAKRELSFWTVTSVPPVVQSEPESSKDNKDKKKRKKPVMTSTHAFSLHSVFSLAETDREGVFASETITAVNCLRPRDASLLVVSTTQRLLLLSLSAAESEDNSDKLTTVKAFVELDRIAQANTELALFSLAYYETKSAPMHASAARTKKLSMVHTAEKLEKRFLFWKAVYALENNAKHQWIASCADLSEEKILEVIRLMQPVVRPYNCRE